MYGACMLLKDNDLLMPGVENLTYAQKVCHLSYPSGAFCVALSRTPTGAFESLGLCYMHPNFSPYLLPQAA